MALIAKYKLFCPPFEASIALYESVDNLSEALDLTDDHNFCLIDAKAIFDVSQVLCAVSKATNAKINNKLVTKQLNKEMLFCLSPSKNITEVLKTFGVTPADTSSPIMAVLVYESQDFDETKVSQVFDEIKGKLVAIEELKNFRQQSLIDEIYKLQKCTTDDAKWDLIVSRIGSKVTDRDGRKTTMKLIREKISRRLQEKKALDATAAVKVEDEDVLDE